MTEPAPRPVALVLLPFLTVEQAEQFATMVISQLPGTAAPIVVHGTAYEYVATEPPEHGQIIEVFPESRFESFMGQRGEHHQVLRRILQEVPDASTGPSSDLDADLGSTGEDGGVPEVGTGAPLQGG